MTTSAELLSTARRLTGAATQRLEQIAKEGQASANSLNACLNYLREANACVQELVNLASGTAAPDPKPDDPNEMRKDLLKIL